jgi:hypothetical protein
MEIKTREDHGGAVTSVAKMCWGFLTIRDYVAGGVYLGTDLYPGPVAA